MLFRKREKLHFIRIGKTGSTAIQSTLEKQKTAFKIVWHPHKVTIKDIPVGEKFFFFLRHPVARFTSGFYSRKRQGKPRHYRPWRPIEEVIFSAYDNHNEFIPTLFSENENIRSQSCQFMRGSTHFYSYQYWFEDFDNLKSRINDLFFVGFQETIEPDFEVLKKKLKLNSDLKLPTDSYSKHASAEQDVSLNKASRLWLERWYQQDILFYQNCKNLSIQLNDQP